MKGLPMNRVFRTNSSSCLALLFPQESGSFAMLAAIRRASSRVEQLGYRAASGHMPHAVQRGSIKNSRLGVENRILSGARHRLSSL